MRHSLLKFLAVLFVAFTFMFTSACGGQKSDTHSADNKDIGGKSSSSQPTEVVFWHAMSGTLGKAVDQIVEEFNSSQSQVRIKAVYQGNYDELLNKLKSSLGTSNAPTLVQVYEIGSRFMIDSDAVEPMQTWIDQENFDLSSFEPHIIKYYTFDGKLFSMPFNTSNPILYYNKTMFREAGLNPDAPPLTFDEVREAAKKLTKDGKHGAAFAIYGWFMEQFFAVQGAPLVNNCNGRDALATESLLHTEPGVQTLVWWKSMVDDGSMLNVGRKTSDAQQAFASGRAAMILDSTASLRGILDAVGNKFEVGTAFLPRPKEDPKGGVIIGGASLWMLKDHSEAEKRAAWEFVKFVVSPQIQARWHVGTGYFPVNKKAYEEAIVVENMQKYPQFRTAVEQLHASPQNCATLGAVMGVFPEARQITERAMEEAIGGKKEIQQSLDQASGEITQKIQDYNRSLRK